LLKNCGSWFSLSEMTTLACFDGQSSANSAQLSLPSISPIANLNATNVSPPLVNPSSVPNQSPSNSPCSNHSSDETTYPCLWHTCTEVFTNAEEFLAHLESHLLSPPWRCRWRGCVHKTLCDHRSNLFQHVLMHTNYRPYKCDVPECGYAASSKSWI